MDQRDGTRGVGGAGTVGGYRARVWRWRWRAERRRTRGGWYRDKNVQGGCDHRRDCLGSQRRNGPGRGGRGLGQVVQRDIDTY